MAMGRPKTSLVLDRELREQLESLAHSRSVPAGLVRRATPFNHNVHHHGHCAAAACGSLKPLPAERLRGTDPHLSYGMKLALPLGTTEGPTLISRVVAHANSLNQLSSCSWRTFVAKPEKYLTVPTWTIT